MPWSVDTILQRRKLRCRESHDMDYVISSSASHCNPTTLFPLWRLAQRRSSVNVCCGGMAYWSGYKKVGPALWVPPGPGLRDMLVSGAQRQAAGPASGPGLRRPWRGPCFLPGACARRTSAWACRCQAHNCELLGSDTSLVPTGSDSVILTIVGLESSGY